MCMNSYYLTVFSPTGEKLLEENFEAASDDEAKVIGEKRLSEGNYTEHTMRLTRSGKLILFHR